MLSISRNKFRLIAFLAVLGLLLSVKPAWAGKPADEDFGAWQLYELEAKRGKVRYKLGEELRFREAAGLYYYETRLGGSYDLAKYLSVGGEYLQARQERYLGNSRKFFWESRPRFFATLKGRLLDFTLENRNMVELRFKQQADNTLRYRNLSTVTAPWKWTRFEFQPYAADEIFFESDRNGLVENRLYAGFKMLLRKNVTGSLYYLRQSQKNNAADWRDSNILGLGLKLAV